LSKAFLLLSKSMELDDIAFAEEALRFFERALTLRPNQPNAEANYARTLSRAGQLDVARKRLEQALQIHPDADPLHVTLADILLLDGDAGAAAEMTENSLRRGILTSSVHQSRLAAFYAAAGRSDDARDLLVRIRGASTYYDDFFIASAWAGTGEEEKALQKLQAWRHKMADRVEQRGFFRWWLRVDPNFKALRDKGALEPFLTNEGGPSVGVMSGWLRFEIGF
jgi:tetratricopeptide (TPR) repeat protein